MGMRKASIVSDAGPACFQPVWSVVGRLGYDILNPIPSPMKGLESAITAQIGQPDSQQLSCWYALWQHVDGQHV